MSVKYWKSENEFHIPLLGGDKGVGYFPSSEGLSRLLSGGLRVGSFKKSYSLF